jgi:DNA repair exonuclease SbcCD ATPase subunit
MEKNQNNTNYKNWIFISLIGLLAGLCVYLYLDKNKSKEQIAKTTEALEQTKTDKETVQQEYNAALGRLDDLKSENSQLDSLLTSKNDEIAGLKEKINSILNNDQANAEELSYAKSLIANLNTKLDKYVKEIITLKKENQQLTTDKKDLINTAEKLNKDKKDLTAQNNTLINDKSKLDAEKVDLEKKVALAKVLSASNIKLTPIKKRWLTGKEASTNKANRANKMRIEFDLNDNRLADTEDKTIYIVVYDPSGDAQPNGKFSLVDGTEKMYTSKQIIAYEQGKSFRNIGWEYTPLKGDFEKGEYTIEIYHNGYKIGTQIVTLK